MNLDGLNPEQRAVVLQNGHCLAISCPGSGKTTTLATKTAHLLEQGQRVGAVTFTREAALELRSRVTSLISPDARTRLLVGTFHSMCLFMSFPKRKGTEIYGREILGRITSPFRERWNMGLAGDRDGFILSAIRESGLKMDLKEAVFAIESAKARPTLPLDEATAILVKAYQDQMTAAGMIDFQDIILKTNGALRDGSLTTLPVDSLLVDEFQDTDNSQYEWIRYHGKAGVQLTAVGDDDQSIYAFRRALGYDVMSDFLRDFSAQRILLGKNYRCNEEILKSAEKLIVRNTRRIPKSLIAEKGKGGTVIWKQYESSAEEADAIGTAAEKALAEDSSFTVIARTHKELLDVQRVCIQRKIPYRSEASESIFKRYEVTVFGALLHLLIDPLPNDLDKVMGWTGMSIEDRKVIRKSFSKIVYGKALRDFDTMELSDVGRRIWQAFIRNYKSWQMLKQAKSNFLLIAGTHEWLQDTSQKFTSLEVLRIASELFHPKDKPFEQHISDLRDVESAESRGKKNDASQEKKQINLITAHAAKGLEFDRVWIVGLKEGQFPSEKTSIEEERRLMYVAMTRARHWLCVSATLEKPVSVFAYEAGLLQKPQKAEVVAW